MADTQAKSTATKESASRAATDRNEPISNTIPGLDSMQAFRQGALNLEHWISTNQELTRFMSYRLQKNLSIFDSFAKCKTSQDVASALAKAASDTVHDYADEYDRVLAINLAAAR